MRPVATTGTHTSPTHVVLLENIHPLAAERWQAAETNAGCRVEAIGHALEGEALHDAIADATIIGIRSKTHLNAESLDAAPNLLAIGCHCIGTNQVDLDHARSRGIAVFNAPFSNTRSVAELTIAEIILLLRRLVDRNAELHRGTWRKTSKDAHEVRGRTLGIIGYGHIGSQVSVLAESLGMVVRFVDVAETLPLGNAQRVETLHQLLEISDVVTIHVPATPQTEKMIDAGAIARMKPGAMLINNARGSVVDLEALAAAVQSGHLGGAAVDVYPQEPRGNDESFHSPLAGLPNVLLTPHIAGSTEEAQEHIARDVTEKLLRYLRDGSTTSAVNLPAVDLPRLRADQHRILHIHRNVPGVLSRMHRAVAEMDININAEYLQSDAAISYVMLDIDPQQAEAVVQRLREVPETIRVRSLYPASATGG